MVVTAPDNCSWTVVSNDTWITVTSLTDNSGPATVTYNVSENSEATPRAGTLTIAGETYTVYQAAQSCDFHSGDFAPADWRIDSDELNQIIGLYRAGEYHCNESSGDGYMPGAGQHDCDPHTADYNPVDWKISLSELLRAIQIRNVGAYDCDSSGEDGYGFSNN